MRHVKGNNWMREGVKRRAQPGHNRRRDEKDLFHQSQQGQRGSTREHELSKEGQEQWTKTVRGEGQ